MSNTPQYDCLSCGACCTTVAGGHLEPFISLPEFVDYKCSMPGIKHAIIWRKSGYGTFKLKQTKFSYRQCWFLSGPLGDCHCAIHPIRPDACKEFEPGCTECKDARRAIGLKF